VQFDEEQDHYVVTVTWWGVDVHVQEWAVATITGPDRLDFIEAEQPDENAFIGFVADGHIEIESDGAMTLHQFGHLDDGSAAAFAANLVEVDSLPEIPIDRTYPAP
jgi:hypothetical protein